jgi:tetratricopeptide (TPR) repeat protein
MTNGVPALVPCVLSRGPGGLLVVGFALLVAACAAVPPPRPAPRVSEERSVPASTVPAEPNARGEAVASLSPAEAPQANLLEESNVGEAPGLKPPEEALPAVSEPEGNADMTTAEPGSLLDRIGPATPPNVAAALRLIEDGRQQMNKGNYDHALDRFERAVAIDPTNAYGYYFLAQVHYLKKGYDQAIAFASRAAALSARTDPVWLGRVYSLEGAVFEDAGRYPDARKAYQNAVDADPRNLAARVGVARLTAAE